MANIKSTINNLFYFILFYSLYNRGKELKKNKILLVYRGVLRMKNHVHEPGL